MVFLKKEEIKTERPELLQKENIMTGCPCMEKEQVIRTVGNMLVKGGYVSEAYVDGMLARELTFSTNLGNGIALPHGVESAKENIRHTGIAVMIFPEGTDWDGEDVKLVIGIAASGEEHLNILKNIAVTFSDEGTVEKVVSMQPEEIYQILTGKGV